MENPALTETELNNLVSKSFDRLERIRHEEAAKRCGVIYLRGSESSGGRYIVNVLNKTYTVELGQRAVLDLMTGRQAGGKLSYVILAYLLSDGGHAGPESWHPIQNLLKTPTLTSYFQKNVTRPITKLFGFDSQSFERCSIALGGVREKKMGGSSYSFLFLPKVKLVFQLWAGDPEDLTQPEASISYNTPAPRYLSTIPLIYACEIIVGFLEKESKSPTGRKRA
jgi:hypothetical protein